MCRKPIYLHAGLGTSLQIGEICKLTSLQQGCGSRQFVEEDSRSSSWPIPAGRGMCISILTHTVYVIGECGYAYIFSWSYLKLATSAILNIAAWPLGWVGVFGQTRMGKGCKTFFLLSTLEFGSVKWAPGAPAIRGSVGSPLPG